jgi:hypothetical protein
MYITSYAHIKHQRLSVNGALLFDATASRPVVDTGSSGSLPEFLTDAYKALGMSYPKYHKMDALCKLGMLCMEAAVKESDVLTKYPLDNIAIVLSNAASSLDTDRVHQHSISDKANYFPSPAVFVYTLPNIIIGEMAIKYKITGENAFFVSERFDAQLLLNYLEALFHEETQAAVCGWVEADGDAAEAFIFLVEKSENTNKNSNFKPLNQQAITELYNQ